MQQLMEFVGNHMGLSIGLVVVASMLAWTFIGNVGGGVRLSPTDVTRLINQEDALVLDVRSEAEFNLGHIVNAMHIPLTSLDERVNSLSKFKDKPIIAACKNGQQAPGACSILKKHGFGKLYNLRGGFLAWEGASLPLTKR